MFIYGPRVAVMSILRPYRFHEIRGNMTVTSDQSQKYVFR